MVNTTEGVAAAAVTSMKNKPSHDSTLIVADVVAVRASLAKIG
jgi:hypothetical protein